MDLFYCKPLLLALMMQLGRGGRGVGHVGVGWQRWTAALLITSFSEMTELLNGNPGSELANNVEAGLVAFDGIDIATGV